MLNHAAIVYQSPRNRPSEDAPVMLLSTISMIVVLELAVLGLAGCGSDSRTAGSVHGDTEFRMEGPPCYREAKSNYEAAGTSPDPNAALVKIGAGLIARDDAFGQCTPARDREQTR